MELFKLYYRQQDDNFIMPTIYEPWQDGRQGGLFHCLVPVKRNGAWFEMNGDHIPGELSKSVPEGLKLVEDSGAYRFILKFEFEYGYKL
jgi:hypothetical protein